LRTDHRGDDEGDDYIDIHAVHNGVYRVNAILQGKSSPSFLATAP
jgi:hypothetical protein